MEGSAMREVPRPAAGGAAAGRVNGCGNGK